MVSFPLTLGSSIKIRTKAAQCNFWSNQSMTSKDRHELRYQRRKTRREQKKKSKQIGQSFEEVFSYKHLYKSHRLCRRTVTWKASVQKYVVQAPVLVYRTWKRLMKGTFRSYGFLNLTFLSEAKHVISAVLRWVRELSSGAYVIIHWFLCWGGLSYMTMVHR